MKHTLRELAGKLACRVVGNDSIPLTHVASLKSANAESVVFVDDARNLEKYLGCGAGAVIAGEFAAKVTSRKPILISPQPRLTFARAAKILHATPDEERGVHPSATVPITVHFGRNVEISPRAVLGDHVRIGDETYIGAGCVVDDGVEIGAHCRIDAHVTIYRDTVLGNRVVVQAGAILGSEGFGYVRDEKTGHYEQFPQVGRLVIEDDVEIGANSTIDRGALDETRIRRGTKIDNLVHIGHNVDIGQDAVLAAQVGISGSATIGHKVIMGGQVGIGDHARVEDGAILGGQCGILPKKIVRGKGIVFWGTPARPLREYLKELAFLARATKKRV